MINFMKRPFRKLRNIKYNTFSYLDRIAETPLKLIPKYSKKQDETLERYLNQLFEDKKPSSFDSFKVSFQSNTVKSIYMLTDTISGYLALITLNPLYLIIGDGIAGINQYMHKNRIDKIYNSMPERERYDLKQLVDFGDFTGARKKLYAHYL
ncbi:MAG: hypothetical protein KAJ47_03070 [Candidatus Aenigmarchaeota archaeon]|nr:hypothetical protein [Candidatus Aenigmarchaeota archaeon]